MASTRLTKVYGSSGNRRTYTLSAWVKRSGLGSHQDIISAYRSTDGLQTDVMRFQSDDKFQFYMHTTSGGTNAQLTTIRKLRDTNAWSPPRLPLFTQALQVHFFPSVGVLNVFDNCVLAIS